MKHASRRIERAVFAGALLLASTAAEARAAGDDLSLDLGGARLELRRIPKGTFVEGSASAETGHEHDEEGPRPVSITRDMWMGKYPVTRGQYARFIADAHYVTEAEKGQSGGWGWDGKALTQRKDFTWRNPGFAQTDEHPVVLVTFADATAFTTWASRTTGRRVRLPTEAEWEYAARARTTTPWYGGATEQDALAVGWFKPNAGNTTHPVGQKAANAFGLFDMVGNVNAWCSDVYAPFGKEPAADPEQVTSPPSAGTEPERRVLRGGSWLKDPKRGRSAARSRNTPGTRNADNGFRVVVANDDMSLLPAVGGATGDLAPSAPASLGSASPDAARPDGVTGAPAPEAFSWTLLLLPPIVAGAAVIAWLLLRRGRGSANAFETSTRTVDDGFWIHAPTHASGMRARYSCVANGVAMSDAVPLDGNHETFVYTGGVPSDVRILEVMDTSVPVRSMPLVAPRISAPENDDDDVAANLIDDLAPPSNSSSSLKSATPDSAPFLGDPRAY